MKSNIRKHQIVLCTVMFLLFVCLTKSYAQNSMTGDGFGGRSWYVAHNYQVGAYSAYTVCGTEDQLYGWGHNGYGELGNNTTQSTIVPIPIPGMTGVKFYATGYVSGVIKNDNTAWVWGTGNIDAGLSGFSLNPAQVLSDVFFLDGGSSHIAFVKNDHTVWAAGQNDKGQLGNGTISPVSNPIKIPVQMTGITNAVRVVALGYSRYENGATLILLADGTLKITGGGGWYTQTNNTIPVTIPGLSNIVDIKGGGTAAFALNANGEVYAFGRELSGFQFGELGLGVATYTYTPPTKLSFPVGTSPIVALSANNDGLTAMALDENGKVYGWGFNVYGQLGDGTEINRNRPVLIATNAVDIYAGETFNYILKADNTLWAAGSSGYGPGYGSIFMNQPDIRRNNFIRIDPIGAPMNLCAPKPDGNICATQVYLGNDTTICAGEKLILNTGISNAVYLWQDNSINSGYTVTKPGTYWVRVTQNGCQKSDTIVVRVKDCNCILNIPNAITPNNDGANDRWIISKQNCIQQLDVFVYNRYGSLVYQKNDYQNDWEGTYGLKPLADGTYYYVVKVLGFDRAGQILKGNLTILR